MRLPILYSLTSNSLTQTWQIEVKDECYRTHEGILEGKITTSEWTECFGKNIGKSNETQPAEQADKEAAAKHKKKLDEGYHENVDDINESKFFEPQLAKKWEDEKAKVIYPIYAQPKLDGMRCLASKDGLFSRKGKIIKSAEHIFEELRDYHAKNPNHVFDGELYCHKFKKNFDKIISLAKQQKPTKEDLAESAKHLEYWVYDVSFGNSLSFKDRFMQLEGTVLDLPLNSKIKLVPTYLCKNLSDLDTLYQDFLEQGFEGQMIRNPKGVYENKRSKFLLKRKEFIDEEFELLDLEEGKGNLAGIAAKAFLVTKGGIRFDAGMIGSHEYCADLLKNKKKVIGKMATVVFQNLTPEGKPRFAKLKIIRDYE